MDGNGFKSGLKVLRLFTYGSTKPPGRAQYMRLLHTQDTAFLRLLGEFGASSTEELEELAKEARSRRFAELSSLTVSDWVRTASRRGLVEGLAPSGGPSRWLLTESGRAQARGLRRHFESASRMLIGLLKWGVPLALGSAALAALGKVNWQRISESDAPLIALVVLGYLALIVIYTVVLRYAIALQSLVIIELSRRTEDLPAIDLVEPAPVPTSA